MRPLLRRETGSNRPLAFQTKPSITVDREVELLKFRNGYTFDIAPM